MPRPQRSNPNTRHNAIELRREPTPAERKLWSRIRDDQLGVNFRRQHAIGSYIVDFCAPRTPAPNAGAGEKLIIELDGSQHLDQKEYDEERTKYLELRGYRVLRLWNHNVMNHIDEVLNVIWNVLPEEIRDPQR